MNIETKMLIIGIILLMMVIPSYPYWSYREWYKRCVENSKHSEWKPFCGKNFLKKGEK